MKHIFGIILLMAAHILPPRGAAVEFSPAQGEGWTRVRTAHFTLLGDAAARDIEAVGLRLEQFRETFGRLFGGGAAPEKRITVIVFRNEDGFGGFKPLHRGAPSDVSGYFHSSDDRSYIVLGLGGRGAGPYRIIQHEYAHVLAGELWGKLPTWLSEGLADYFSAFELGRNGAEAVTGLPIAEHVRRLKDGKAIPLAALLAANQDSDYYNDRELKLRFYAQSWALVHYLLHGNGGSMAPALFSYLRGYSPGARPSERPAGPGFEKTTPGFEAGLREYLRRGQFNPARTAFDRRLEFDSSLSTHEAGRAEVLGTLGDLLWRLGRREEARRYFALAFEAGGETGPAHTSIGILEYRDGNYPEAARHLERSTSSGSTDHLAWYYLAMSLLWGSSDSSRSVSRIAPEIEARMRAALGRAIELAPDFADSYRQLAFINLVNDRDLDAAAALLERALGLAPGREDIRFTLAQVRLRRHEFASAREIASDLARNASRDDVRSNSIHLLESIGRTEELVAKMALDRARSEEAAARTLPGRRFEGDQVRGLLVRIDCPDSGLTLTVRSGNRPYRFFAPAERRPVFVRFTPEIPNEIVCGPVSPQPVIVTYRKSTDPRSRIEGEPVGVEFIREP